MAIQPQQVQRKRKCQSDPAYTLVRRSLCCAGGTIHLKSYRETAQTNTADVLNFPVMSIPATRSLDDGSNKARRNLAGPIRMQYLRDASCLEEFKSVFTQAIRSHRTVYMKTGNLHRNLSPNKIMFTRNDRGAPLGFLQDWDQAKFIPADQPSLSPSRSSRHRTGATPFLAFELLREESPLHLYRHDLKSYMYILIWCALHFNLNGSEVPGVSVAVERWTYGSWEAIHDAKSAVISNVGDRQEKILSEITPAFRPLEHWIEGLFDMFEEGDRAVKDRNKRLRRGQVDAAGAWNEETAGGLVTYEKFMAVIGEGPDLDI